MIKTYNTNHTSADRIVVNSVVYHAPLSTLAFVMGKQSTEGAKIFGGPLQQTHTCLQEVSRFRQNLTEVQGKGIFSVANIFFESITMLEEEDFASDTDDEDYRPSG